MREYLSRHRMRALGIGTVVAALAVALLTLYAVPLNPPLGNCFGGALSDDPVHCYVLEEAYRDGVINVEKVYDADEVLYFAVKQSEPLSEDEKERLAESRKMQLDPDVGIYFRAKASEFYDRWPDDVPYLESYSECVRHLKPSYRECYLAHTLPRSAVYQDIRFYAGGDDARRLIPGWGSWRQIWPIVPVELPPSEAQGETGSAGTSETPGTPTPAFDVSDVDVTNDLPVHECPETYTDLHWCSRNPELAVRVVATRSEGGTTYVQMKNPPEDEEGFEALRYMLNPCYNVQSGPCKYIGTEAVREVVDGVETIVKRTGEVQSSYVPADPNSTGPVIIPVKYDKGELKRWAEILNRFALSQGNTIGVTKAEVGDNGSRYTGLNPLYPLDSLGPAPWGANGAIRSELRETIVVRGSTSSQRIADALPTLLPLLGIPTDAVGVVLTSNKKTGATGFAYDRPGLVDRESAEPQGWFGLELDVPMQLLLVTRNVGAVLVLSAVALLVMRLRRRASSA